MKDKGTVVSLDRTFARVQVECLTACEECSAHVLCIGNKQPKGLLSVKNPLNAQPGDRVTIDIPEERYSRALSFLFGGLVLAALIGAAAGMAAGKIFSLPAEESSLGGLFLGLILAGLGLLRYFRKENQKNLYPVIININGKGD